jgi:PD-(D/E)XK nuclease superfamily protein
MENQVEHFLEKIKLINYKHEEVLNHSHAKFNLFSILRNESDEVYLHSAFIGELLNPKGSHGMGKDFLDLFCEVINKLGENINISFDNETKIEIEKPIGEIKTGEAEGGRLDLYISNNETQLAIENKIYAEDQEKQLRRYHNFLNKITSTDNYLLYLTLDGSEPSDDSKFELTEDQYINISYKEHIQKWLELCKQKAVDIPILRESIQQYINLIQKLTGLNKDYIMEIASILSKSSINLKLAKDINEAFIESKIEIQYNFWESLSESLGGIFDKEYSKEMITAFYKQSRNNRYYSIKTKVLDFNDDKQIYFRIEIDHGIYFGFCLYRGKEHLNKCEEEEFNLVANLISGKLDNTFSRNQWWLGWVFPKTNKNGELNFNAFNSNEIFELADPIKMKETTDKIAIEVENLISNFKKEYNLLPK